MNKRILTNKKEEEQFEKYIESLKLFDMDSLFPESKYIYSQKSIQELIEYYYGQFKGDLHIKMKKSPKIDRKLAQEMTHNNKFGRQGNSIFIGVGNLVREEIESTNLLCSLELLEILPNLSERITAYEIDRGFSSKILSMQASFYQLKKAKEAAFALEEIDHGKCSAYVDRTCHERMILASAYVPVLLDCYKTDRNGMLKQIHKILLHKESVDSLLEHYQVSMLDERARRELSNEMTALKMARH